MRTFFTFASDGATHQAVFFSSLNQEFPKSFFASIVLSNKLVWEATSFFILKQNFLWQEPSEILDSFVNIARNQVAITSVHLCICFFNQCDPQLVRLLAMAKNVLLCLNIYWHSVVNNHINPLEVFVNANDIDSSASVSMEDWGIYSF